MTPKECIEQLQNAKLLIMANDKDWLDKRDLPILEMTIKALEKQIPKRPDVPIDTWICPDCGHPVEYQKMLGDNILGHFQYDFCPSCGQAIDWSEEDECNH